MTSATCTAPTNDGTKPAALEPENYTNYRKSNTYPAVSSRSVATIGAVSPTSSQGPVIAELDLNTVGSAIRSPQLGRNRYRLAESLYLPEKHQKDLIVLHFTAGTSCESAYRTWAADPRRIATAYGVDPDGTIEEFFPPEAWAFHLGIRGTRRHDQRSIGIEIANVGPLRPDPSNPKQLNWWPGNWGTRYCDLCDEHNYVAKQYRDVDYFAVMPDEQQHAVASLVRYLCKRFRIPVRVDDAARDGVYDLKYFASYAGIASHANFRRDKWDVGPAFRWEELDRS